MFDNQKTKLTKEEKNKITKTIKKAKNKPKRIKSVQDSIPYIQIFPDGICQLEDNIYSKTIQFDDINYQLLKNEDKSIIFEGWCDFLNYFDNKINFQLSFLNTTENADDLEDNFCIPFQDDDFNSIRLEYMQMLQSKISENAKRTHKTKYISFSIEAENIRIAKPRIERIESDLISSLSKIGVNSYQINGKERLKILRTILRMNGSERFVFDWKMLAQSGLTTKDFIAPYSLEFREKGMFKTEDTFCSVSFLNILSPELKDKVLADFIDINSNQLVTMHIQPINQLEAIKMIKRKMTEIDAMKIKEQKRAVNDGYDMDILPPDIDTYGSEAKKLLSDLQSHNERMFLITLIIVNSETSRKKLDNTLLQVSGKANQYNCPLVRLDYQQEQGFMSSLPLARNYVQIQRTLTTSSTAVFVPFVTKELFDNSKESLYYGLNSLSDNPIMIDRKRLKNPSGLILGTPGSGKSFSAKREMTNVFLITEDDIIICDPEAEYFQLVQRLGGQVIKISPTSTQYINPMDINLSYSEEDNPLVLKSDFILSLCELIVGGKGSLTPIEKSVIDRCLTTVYNDYFADPKPENMPILEDLYNALETQDEKEAQSIRSALEIYVRGSLNVFNHRTNVDIKNRIVCFDIKSLGNQLKKLGMLIVQDQVWNRVTKNRAEKKSTRYYVDEFHLLLKDEQTAAYSVEIWKRFRKWGGIPTAITQNVKDLLASREIENIFENSDFIYMLNQAPGDKEILTRQLNISPKQIEYVTGSGVGEGLLFYGSVILPFADKFPKNTELYRIMTTNLTEIISG